MLHAVSSLLIATKPALPIYCTEQISRSPPLVLREVRLHTTPKSNLLHLRRHPVGHRGRTDLVPEPNHAADRDVAMLAKPAVRTARGGARPRPAVWSAIVRRDEGVAGEHARRPVRVREREDRRRDVGVRGRVDVERATVLWGFA